MVSLLAFWAATTSGMLTVSYVLVVFVFMVSHHGWAMVSLRLFIDTLTAARFKWFRYGLLGYWWVLTALLYGALGIETLARQ
jgi:hypothetical protein